MMTIDKLYKLYRLKDLVELFSVTRGAIYDHIRSGKFPPPDKRVGRIPYWKKETVEAFLESELSR